MAQNLSRVLGGPYDRGLQRGEEMLLALVLQAFETRDPLAQNQGSTSSWVWPENQRDKEKRFGDIDRETKKTDSVISSGRNL